MKYGIASPQDHRRQYLKIDGREIVVSFADARDDGLYRRIQSILLGSQLEHGVSRKLDKRHRKS